MSNSCSTQAENGLLSGNSNTFLMREAIGSVGYRGGNHEVATKEGDYLGTIADGDRFYYFEDRPRRPHPGNPAPPTYPAHQECPVRAKRAVPPVGATDMVSLQRSRDQRSESSAEDIETARTRW